MRKNLIFLIIVVLLASCGNKSNENQTGDMKTVVEKKVEPFTPPVSRADAEKRAEEIMAKMTVEEKISLIGGHNFFYVKGFEQYGIPTLYLSDATQGVHIRSELTDMMEKSVAFPCPSLLVASWNPEIANQYATAIGEECRAGEVAVLLGPGMNIYRVSQNGRNFEYFGEDPYLAARMIENYVVGVQSTGTMATLKHFLVNNHEFHRRKTNVIVDERTIHEIYTPAFKAGIDAGAMAVMTSYNMVNGEWAGESKKVITDLLRNKLGFQWLVMSDWWSVWNPQRTITSGMDLEMPGEAMQIPRLLEMGDVYVRSNAQRLLDEGKIQIADIDRMVKNILTTTIAMGLLDRPIKDESLLAKFPEHEKIALQTAREGIVLLKNTNNILPIAAGKKILLTGEFVEKLARGGGSAEVEGYDIVQMITAMKAEFGDNLTYSKNPTEAEIKAADVVLISAGRIDCEGWDVLFELPDSTNKSILNIAALNPNTVVIVNAGGGVEMTPWNDKVAAVVYSWYVGQNGNTALAEIISGKTNPSGKLPITIEKTFADSPGFGYIPEEADFYVGWDEDMNMQYPQVDVEYDEGVFVGYRWYEKKNIAPLYHFGYGLSYTTFNITDLKLSANEITANETVTVQFVVTNTGTKAGAEVAQLYIKDVEASVERPVKELKGFQKVFLQAGESVLVEMVIEAKDLSFFDMQQTHDWKAEAGEFKIMVGNASNNILQEATLVLK